MILIIGGAYQGKLDYAMREFGFNAEEIADGKTASAEEMFTARCICNLHLFIKRLCENGEDAEEFARLLYEKNSRCAVICDEIGSGIIPMEKSERFRREQTGRVCCFLAGCSEKVIRINCGLPVFIKGGA